MAILLLAVILRSCDEGSSASDTNFLIAPSGLDSSQKLRMTNKTNTMKKYWKIFSISLQNSFEDRGRLIVSTIESLITPFVSILLWLSIYQFQGVIRAGWNLNQLITYFLIMTFTSLFLSNSIDKFVGTEHIEEGRLTHYLVKPISYTAYIFHHNNGQKLIRIFLFSAPYFFLVFYFRKYVQLNLTFNNFLAAIIFLAIAFQIMFYLKLILGLSSFWLIKNDGVVNLYWVISYIFSGLLIPYDFLPQTLKTISNILPFRFFYYYPATAFLGKIPSRYYFSDLIIALSWIIILFLIGKYMFIRGIQHFTDTKQ